MLAQLEWVYIPNISQNRTLLLKCDFSRHLKGCLWGGEGVAEVLIFLLRKHFPFSEMGCLIKQAFFLFPVSQLALFFYLFVSKGSVVFLVVNQLHWLWTRWTGKFRKNKGRCIYRTAVPWQWSQLQLQAQLRSTAPIQQERCAWNLLLSMTSPLLKVTVVYRVPQYHSTSAAVLT